MPNSPVTGLAQRVPAPLFIVGSGLIQYVGAAVAVGLFAVLTPYEVAWWRILVAGVVLLAWRRPWRGGLTRTDLAHSAVFGVAMTAMNMSFYEAISRLPLGAAVSIEFIGPVAVAVVRGRGWRPRVAAVTAFAGVASIGGLGLDLRAEGVALGLVWILAAAAAWSAYIVLGQRIASQRSGITNLSLGAAVGALVAAPIGAPGSLWAAADPRMLLALVAVGVLSTVIPYSFEALAMSRVSAATFALLTALLPATSAIVGAVMLHQVPSPWELVGLALVSVAIWIASHDPEA